MGRHDVKNTRTIRKTGPLPLLLACAVVSSTGAFADDTSGDADARADPSPVTLPLYRGKMADYGATPWYTNVFQIGDSKLKFALDTGTTLLWATSDKCTSVACNAHRKVNTTQPSFRWVHTPTPPIDVDFGPWGNMGIWIAQAPYRAPGILPDLNLVFDASVSYEGEQFQYLAWDGGIGFPSGSEYVKGHDFYFQKLIQNTGIRPFFATYTADANGEGAFILGGTDTSKFDRSTQIQLEPTTKTIPGSEDLWGTDLHSVSFDDVELPALSDQVFFVDSGSSRFKGDAKFIYPILDALQAYKDPSGTAIFAPFYEKINKEDQRVGLVYVKGGPADHPNLPYLYLRLGQSCFDVAGVAGQIILSPEQYSYKVEVGARAGEWVIAAHRLDGIGGLLVGSTFMDLVYTEFNYGPAPNGGLVQGPMNIYKKTEGKQPASYSCVREE